MPRYDSGTLSATTLTKRAEPYGVRLAWSPPTSRRYRHETSDPGNAAWLSLHPLLNTRQRRLELPTSSRRFFFVLIKPRCPGSGFTEDRL